MRPCRLKRSPPLTRWAEDGRGRRKAPRAAAGFIAAPAELARPPRAPAPVARARKRQGAARAARAEASFAFATIRDATAGAAASSGAAQVAATRVALSEKAIRRVNGLGAGPVAMRPRPRGTRRGARSTSSERPRTPEWAFNRTRQPVASGSSI